MTNFILFEKEVLRSLIREEVKMAVSTVKAEYEAQKKDTSKYRTRQEAADELRISLSSLHRLISTGQLPCVKIGRKSVFRDKDIQRVGITLNR